MSSEEVKHEAPPEDTLKSLRIAVDVVAGLVPGKPELEFTKRYYITSEEWHASDDKASLMIELNGKALSWANYLMLQPDRLNWVKTEWIYF